MLITLTGVDSVLDPLEEAGLFAGELLLDVATFTGEEFFPAREGGSRLDQDSKLGPP